MNRPITTLFMLMSVDGKISTGSMDELDVDRDFPKIDGEYAIYNDEPYEKQKERHFGLANPRNMAYAFY